MAYYHLTYRIDFSEMLIDEGDYIHYMNMIQTFVNTGMKNQLIISEPSILPAYDETKSEQEFIIRARFKNSEDLQCAQNMLYSFCVLNFLRDDPKAKIEIAY